MPDSSDHRKAQAKSSHWGCQRPSWLAGSLKATEPTLSKLWQKFNRWLTTLMKKYLSLSICHIRKQSLHINLTPSNKQRVCCCADWDLGYSDLILSRCLLVGNCIPPESGKGISPCFSGVGPCEHFMLRRPQGTTTWRCKADSAMCFSTRQGIQSEQQDNLEDTVTLYCPLKC